MKYLKTIIRPCPCCGGEAKVAEHACYKAVFVVCISCHLSTENVYYDGVSYPSFASRERAEEIAVAKWNRRTKICLHSA